MAVCQLANYFVKAFCLIKYDLINPIHFHSSSKINDIYD